MSKKFHFSILIALIMSSLVGPLSFAGSANDEYDKAAYDQRERAAQRHLDAMEADEAAHANEVLHSAGYAGVFKRDVYTWVSSRYMCRIEDESQCLRRECSEYDMPNECKCAERTSNTEVARCFVRSGAGKKSTARRKR